MPFPPCVGSSHLLNQAAKLNQIFECLNEVGLPSFTRLVLYLKNHAYASCSFCGENYLTTQISLSYHAKQLNTFLRQGLSLKN